MLIALSGVTGFWAFVERIGSDIGATPDQMGIILAILKIIGGVAGFTAVIAGAKYGLRWPHWLAMILIVACHAAPGNYQWITAIYVAGLWFWEFGFTLAFGYQCGMLARLDRSGRSLLLVPSCLGLAGVIGPGLAGYLKTGDSYFYIYCFAAVCAVLSSSVFLMLLKKNDQHILTDAEVIAST